MDQGRRRLAAGARARVVGKTKPKYEKLRKEHWAWQPLHEVRRPTVNDASWPRADIDRFLLAELEAKGLKPVGDADKLTLIRRVTFDLTGLPPTPEEIDAFLNDDSADAFEKVVDRLLASPAFGERWGRHWLDVARYGESTGLVAQPAVSPRLAYRDYVIDAFNARQALRSVHPRTDRRRPAARAARPRSAMTCWSPPASSRSARRT